MRKTTKSEGRWPTGRVLSVTGALGVVATSLSIMQPASAAPPTFPDNVVVFPDRDFVSVEGYERYAGELALVQVTRDGQVMGSARVEVSGTDVAFEVNHPGGACWGAGTNLQVTPDIKAGDVVSVTFPDGNVEETVTSSAAASDMVRVDPTTVTVSGTFGAGVNPEFLEQRIIQPDFVGTAIGKRDIRAVPGGPTAGPNGGYVSTFTFPAAGEFLATYEFDSPDLADIAMAADLGERAMNWQVQDPDGNRQGLTIAEFGEAGGPGMGGCPAGPGQQEAPAGSATAVRPAGAPDSMVVDWTPASAQPGAAAVTGYQVEAIEQGATPSNIIGRRLGASATSTTLTGLDPAKNYTVEVRSLTGTEPKMSVPFPMDAAAPQLGDVTPPTLSVGPLGTGTVRTDAVTVTSDGQVFFTTGPIGGPPVPVVSGDTPSDAAELLTGANPKSIPITAPVHLAIVAFDQAGNVSDVFEGDFEPAPLPDLAAAPTGLAGTATQSSVALTWNASADATVTGYQVKVTPPAGQTVATPPVTSIARQTISGLSPGTSYQFQVATINAAGTGAFSAPITVNTPAATDRVTISTATWKSGDFRVVGTGSQPTATIRLFRVDASGAQGTAITGAVTTVVAAAPPGIGDWTIRLRDAAAGNANPGRIMAVSSGGGTTAPFTVVNK